MVLQQRLACNHLMTELSRACVCGHVFEEASRFISGKRFSEYRAKLYSRLETKKMKRKAVENGPKGSNCIPSHSVSNPMNLTATRRRSARRKNSDKSKRRKRYPRMQMNRSTRLKQQPNMGKIVSAQLLSRLPNALREINRRIFVQNIMWLELQTE